MQADARFELRVEAKKVQVNVCHLISASDVRCKTDASTLRVWRAQFFCHCTIVASRCMLPSLDRFLVKESGKRFEISTNLAGVCCVKDV